MIISGMGSWLWGDSVTDRNFTRWNFANANLSDNLNYRNDVWIKSIATRLRDCEVLELSEQEVADGCRLSVDEYRDMESGDADISGSMCCKTIARRYGISLMC